MIGHTIHSKPVIAFAQTEIQSTGPCGIVIVELRKPGESPYQPTGEWCVAWYRVGEREWSNGFYTTDKQAAFRDFCERASCGYQNGGR